MTNEKIEEYERIISLYIDNNQWIVNPKENDDPIITYIADTLINEAIAEEKEITIFMHSFEQFGEIYLIELHNRFKKKWRLEQKVESKLSEGVSISELVHSIKDTLRYTFIIEDNVYVSKVEEILRSIEERYKLNSFKNSWSNSYYKGINSSFMLDNGFLFEVQFHTPTSYTIKEGKLRDVYNIIRNPNSDPKIVDIANRIRLYYQSFVKIPDGAIEFNYESRKQVK